MGFNSGFKGLKDGLFSQTFGKNGPRILTDNTMNFTGVFSFFLINLLLVLFVNRKGRGRLNVVQEFSPAIELSSEVLRVVAIQHASCRVKSFALIGFSLNVYQQLFHKSDNTNPSGIYELQCNTCDMASVRQTHNHKTWGAQVIYQN